MTIAQLIDALRKYPKDMEVGFVDTEYSDDSLKLEPFVRERKLYVFDRIVPKEGAEK